MPDHNQTTPAWSGTSFADDVHRHLGLLGVGIGLVIHSPRDELLLHLLHREIPLRKGNPQLPVKPQTDWHSALASLIQSFSWTRLTICDTHGVWGLGFGVWGLGFG